MTKNLSALIFAGTLLLTLAARPYSIAQTTTARISGVVSDASGGVIPGARVIIANIETGVRRSAVTDEQGRFVVPQLPPGFYETTVIMTGFETLVHKAVTLTVGQEASFNLTMTVGAVTQQTTVVGEAPLVDTSTSTVSGVVEARRITELPLNGRDFTQERITEAYPENRD